LIECGTASPDISRTACGAARALTSRYPGRAGTPGPRPGGNAGTTAGRERHIPLGLPGAPVASSQTAMNAQAGVEIDSCPSLRGTPPERLDRRAIAFLLRGGAVLLLRENTQFRKWITTWAVLLVQGVNDGGQGRFDRAR
jgi:hypothetical protein